MKRKYIIGILLIGLMATTACVYAAETTLGDYKFNIPAGFEIAEQADDGILLTKDNETEMVVQTSSSLNTEDEVVASLEEQGMIVTAHQTIKTDDGEVIEAHYTDGTSQASAYGWEVEDGKYIVCVYAYSLEGPAVEWDKSPAKTIHDTLTAK